MSSYEAKLKQIVLADERFVVMTAENRAAIRGLPPVLGNRFIDTGITEQTMIGAAAGLALRGRVPVAHALATFLTLRAFEFIRTDVGIPGLPVKLVGAVPGVLSDGNGPTHQALEDVALMRGIPGMEVFCPGDHEEMVAGLESFLKSPHPGYLRYNPRPAPTAHRPFVWGKAETFGEGRDVVLVTHGGLFTEALQARELLEADGIEARLVNVRTLRPFDEETVLAAMHSARLTVTIEDHFQTGGLYTLLAETLLARRRTARVEPIAFAGKWFKPATLPRVLEHERMNGPALVARVRAFLESGGNR